MRTLLMESALHGIAASTKHSACKEAVGVAKESLRNEKEKGDVPIPYLRDKCLAAIELAFDHGGEKTAHYAVEGVQALLRDRRFHSVSIEHPQHNLPTQVLHAMTGIAQWNSQLQCHCLTLLVEMICSTELMVSLQEVEECLELYMRVFGASKEESVRVSARAAVSQSVSSYLSNRYGASEESSTDLIAVYMDVTKILEEYIKKLDQLTTSNDQSVILFDATNALLTAQPITIRTHQPFVNLLWEKLCPLMICLLGVPDKNISTTNVVTISTDEPIGQGQINKFALSPAAMSNPEATRALYIILEQLIRIMSGVPSVGSALEALFHKAFLYPKIEQRGEAIRIIRRILSDPRRIADLAISSTSTNSISLWRMMIVCLLESANPNFEVALEAVRTCASMLQGILDFSRSTQLLDEETKKALNTMFPTLEAATVQSFTARSAIGSCSPRPSSGSRSSIDPAAPDTPTIQPTNSEATVTEGTEEDDEISETLKKLTHKFGLDAMGADPTIAKIASTRSSSTDSVPRKILNRRSTEYDESSEKVTAKKFADCLLDKLEEWQKLKSTLMVDEAILQFAASFYGDFSAVHNEMFKSKSKIQQEFLNTDAIYLTAYASLTLILRGTDVIKWAKFKECILCSGCTVYVSESWLKKVFQYITEAGSQEIKGSLKEVIQDFDGFDNKLLSDVERLKAISQGPLVNRQHEEKLASRWLLTSAWDSIVKILSTFLGIKEREKARQKIIEGIEYSINGMQLLAQVALEMDLASRCGWIFEKLVETSCDVDELRAMATADEQKRWSIVGREDLLSIQLVLDNAFVSVHAPECWKHVIRCTEYVWELEKFIFGALCYEKPSIFSFGRKKKEKKEEADREEDVSFAERSVERALGDRELAKDTLNKALAVLIAKVDRFYSLCGRQLSLRSLRKLCVSLVSASENRIFYSGQKAAALTPSVNLLARVSEIVSSIPNRPIVHQMLIWPIIGAHFIQISCSAEESRSGVSALSDCASDIILSEATGMCFNHMLLAPFQAIVCSDQCSAETRQQVVSALSDYVRTKSDTLGSGWKPLFGALRAVRTTTVEDASVHWTVLDVIGTYLGIKRSSVLSWSLPDCFPCIIHFLQATECEATEIEDKLSEAALRLVQPTYAVILNMYNNPHIPNHNLLHRLELRSTSFDEMENTISFLIRTGALIPPLSSIIDPYEDYDPTQLDKDIEVPHGTFPWDDLQGHQLASLELLFILVEQLSGTLATAPPLVQPPLMRAIQQLIESIKKSEFGPNTVAFCISSLLLPHIQKWLQRISNDVDIRNIKQAVGTCVEMVLDFMEEDISSDWSTRLLSDICQLSVECCGQPTDISRVGAACLRHISSLSPKFTESQWTILQKSIWDGCSATLHPLRLLCSFFIPNTDLDNSHTSEVFLNGTAGIQLRDRILAEQVFFVDSQKSVNGAMSSDEPEEGEPAEIVLMKDNEKYRVSLSWLISSLVAHQLLLQLLAALLSTTETTSPVISKQITQGQSFNVLHQIPVECRHMFYYCLDASVQISKDLDSRSGLTGLISKCSRMQNVNLFKQMVSASLIKLNAMYQVARKDGVWADFTRCLQKSVDELRQVEQRTAKLRIQISAREHKEQKFEFMLVDASEKLYKIVDEDQINSTIAEYERQRPLGSKPLAGNRKNPFTDRISMDGAKAEEQQCSDIDSLRLLAYRDVCLIPAQLLLEQSANTAETRATVISLLDPLKNLIMSSPDLSIRSLAIDLIDLLSK